MAAFPVAPATRPQVATGSRMAAGRPMPYTAMPSAGTAARGEVRAMTIVTASIFPRARRAVRSAAGTREGAGWRRAALAAAVLTGAVWGLWDTSAADTAQAVSRAGADLTRLLRFMAVVKAAMATGALAALWWRLGVVASPVRLSVYLATAAAMGAGPGLIWAMAHVAWGALLLHGGLFAALVLLWRDPAVGMRLAEAAAVPARSPETTDRRHGVTAVASTGRGVRSYRSPPGR